jgi:DNA-binding FadR family transcriptional regulator
VPSQSIEPQRLYRQIADQLSRLIEAGEFAVGARLPAERDLARQLGVSRPSVREALIAMEVEGRVEVRTGSGVYVLEPRIARSRAGKPAVGKPAARKLAPVEWGPLELIRARRVVEGEVAAMAAALIKRKDLQELAAALQSMRDDAAASVMPLEGDRRFHAVIARACGNTVLSEMVQSFSEARDGPVFTRLGGYFETLATWRAAISEHERIFEAMLARDPDAARLAMQDHMDRAHARFNVSWRKLKPGSRGGPESGSVPLGRKKASVTAKSRALRP